MTGRAKCEPGCTCKKHGRTKMSPEEKARKAKEKNRNRYAKNAESLRLYARERRAADPLRAREIDRRSKAAHAESRRARQREAGPERRLQQKYGLSLEQWARMAKEQEGCCYLCNEPLDMEAYRAVHVDHDHACCRGQKSCGTCIRGLACQKCNHGIGHFGDDPERMRRVADNLEMANRKLRESRRSIPEQLAIDIE